MGLSLNNGNKLYAQFDSLDSSGSIGELHGGAQSQTETT